MNTEQTPVDLKIKEIMGELRVRFPEMYAVHYNEHAIAHIEVVLLEMAQYVATQVVPKEIPRKFSIGEGDEAKEIQDDYNTGFYDFRRKVINNIRSLGLTVE